MAEKLNGVIARLPSDTKKGVVNCGMGRVFTFDATALSADYVPQLKDAVEAEIADDNIEKISFLSRTAPSAQSDTTASVDLKVKCPHCGKPMMPKAKIVNGKFVATVCPHCMATLKEIHEEAAKPKKSTPLALIVLAAAAVVLMVLAMTVGQQ